MCRWGAHTGGYSLVCLCVGAEGIGNIDLMHMWIKVVRSPGDIYICI